MPITVSSVNASGVLQVSSTVGYNVTQSVQLSGTPFGGLQTATTYWIIAKTASTLTISSSIYGTALATTAASGAMTLDAYRQDGPGVGNTVTSATTGDYNTIQAIASKVLGAPLDTTPTYGYNQSILSSIVSGGYKITQAQWANLARDLVYARIHQTGSVNEANNLPVPTTSNIITEAFRKSYLDFANLVLQNANSYGPSGQVGTFNIGTATRSQIWNGNIYSQVTLDFGSLANSRAFFNTGGNITVACSLTGTFQASSVAKDNTWSGMFGSMGTVTINANTTYLQGGQATSGYTSTPVNKGYFQLTTTNQLLFTETPPSDKAYAANTLRIYGRLDSTGRYMYLRVEFNDDAVASNLAPSQYGGDEYVDGFLNLYIGCQRAIGSYVTLNSPGTTFTGDLTAVTGSPALYSLSSNSYSVNEGDSFEVTLQTQNVNDGVLRYYTVTGMANTPNGVSRYSASAAYFTISGGKAKITFTVNADLYTDGTSTMTITLDNGLASVSINVNDTSPTPTNYLQITTAGAAGPGSAYWNNNQFTVPAGIYSLTIWLVGGGGGGGNYAGGGGGGGSAISTTVAVSPGQTFITVIGNGGGPTVNGGNTYFGGFSALGGYGGSSGTGSSGGKGGDSGNGAAGGSSANVTINQPYFFAGGGGGGGKGPTGGVGSNATNSISPINTAYAYGGYGGAGVSIINFYGNNVLYLGGGGEGGSSAVDGTSSQPNQYGGGQGGGQGQTGSNGNAGTGGGGGGGGVTSAGGDGTRGINATITGNSGGSGGSGIILIGWP